tara:strand:+ start:1174 stop:1368 length:195 start_codon:yes stop_codon:yes gene_type:complete
MTYHSVVTSENAPAKPRLRLHLFWVCYPYKKGKNMRYSGYSKEEALKNAKANNPGASILWKKEL